MAAPGNTLVPPLRFATASHQPPAANEVRPMRELEGLEGWTTAAKAKPPHSKQAAAGKGRASQGNLCWPVKIAYHQLCCTHHTLRLPICPRGRWDSTLESLRPHRGFMQSTTVLLPLISSIAFERLKSQICTSGGHMIGSLHCQAAVGTCLIPPCTP